MSGKVAIGFCCGVVLACLLTSYQPALADPIAVTYDTVKTHPDMYVEGGIPEGECVGLAVGNHGEMGIAGAGGVNLDFVESGLECGSRPEDGVYLYSGSPFVIVADDADGTNSLLTCSYGDTDGSKPQSWVPQDDQLSRIFGLSNCHYREGWVQTGKMVSRDGKIALERTFIPTDGLTQSIVVATKIYSADGQPHNHVTVGSVIDWNVPSDSSNINVSGITPRAELYLQGTDTVGSVACQSHSGRLASEAVIGTITPVPVGQGPSYDYPDYWGSWAGPQALVRDTNLARDGSTVIDPPQPDAVAWWQDLGDNPGLTSAPQAGNQAVWTTYFHDYDLGAADTLWFWSVLQTMRNSVVPLLETSISEAAGWFEGNALEQMADCCFCRTGDANMSGEDEPTIGDISILVEAKFIEGTCSGVLFCYREADVNMSGGGNATCDDITIGDISLLVDYLFISGPENLDLPHCHE